MTLEQAIKEAEYARKANEALREALKIRDHENRFLRQLIGQLNGELSKCVMDRTYEPSTSLSFTHH